MNRYKLTIEYDGTDFAGWQRQKDSPSIQQTIEEAIYKFSNEQVTVLAAGRTDAGVHAIAQAGHFDLKNKFFDTNIVQNAINYYLKPNKISIIECSLVNSEFHARFSAKKRSYKYLIINRKAPLALFHNKAWHIKEDLCIDSMQKAADVLIGTHDFSSFRASSCQANSPIKTIDEIKIIKIDDKILIEIKAKSFLHHMVRNITGTLRSVGNKKWTIDDFKVAFSAKDRTKAGMTAPAGGLYFLKAEY